MKIPFKFIDDLVRMVRWFRKEEQYRAEAETRQQVQRALKALFPVCVGACLYLKKALKSEVPCYGNQQLL